MTADRRIIGVGSPIVDRLAVVADDFLAGIEGGKGGMELVDAPGMDRLLELVEDRTAVAPGGSAANTVFALARLKIPAALLGKLGDDEEGRYYRRTFEQIGGDCSRLKTCGRNRTACCLSLVTPDSERTMRTDLGAASSFSPEEVSAADFEECSHAHVEGYLLFNPDLAEAVLKSARQAGCTVSLDLGSYEVVQGAAEVLPGMLADYVDVVMANEDEAAAFCGDSDPEVGLEALSRLCELAVVKLGREGAIMKSGDATCRAGARRVEDVKDTTGAGDFWAAGFLYGLINQSGLEDCGRLGAVLGGEAVRHMGADLPAPAWADIIDYFDQYLEER